MVAVIQPWPQESARNLWLTITYRYGQWWHAENIKRKQNMHISMGKNMEKPQDKGETPRNTHLKRDTKATIETQTKGTHPQKSSRMLKLSFFELEHDIQIILYTCLHWVLSWLSSHLDYTLHPENWASKESKVSSGCSACGSWAASTYLQESSRQQAKGLAKDWQ